MSIFSIIDAFIKARSLTIIIAAALILTAGVGALDHFTGFELSFSIFYLLPVVFVSWYVNRAGYVIAIVCASVWLVVDQSSGHEYSHPLIPYWNSVVRMSFFLLISLLLQRIKAHVLKEETLARVDGLTGAMNSRAFLEAADRLVALSARSRKPFTLAYIDIDDFKKVNDTKGHSEGDRALKAVARTLMASVRGADISARLGGDEFAVFLPDTDTAEATVALDRIRENLTLSAKEGEWAIGFSIGAAVFKSPPAKIEEALKLADELMYAVKNSGKNTTRIDEVVLALSQIRRDTEGVRIESETAESRSR
ncbi:MAG: GGDEF domain-containing protein [Planctomycetes bacterium]|nr:GGDEF domain-containing protein [Planctomycetota bacterium]